MKLKIIAHCLVKNEERFIWYSLKSVLPFVDQIMVWDTGSSDNTMKIIKSIKSPKIKLKEVGNVDQNSFTDMRQKMIEQTPKSCQWIMILDGDEIWPMNSIKTATDFAKSYHEYETIVVRTNNLVGDIYHRLPESAGGYRLAGQKGHLGLRFMNLKKIPGLHASLPHGQIGYFDKHNKLVQDRNPKKMKLIDVYYSHATHLQRSSQDKATIKRDFKRKFELGTKIPKSQMPMIFFTKSKPKIVADVTSPAPLIDYLKSAVLTIPRRIKRVISPSRSGY